MRLKPETVQQIIAALDGVLRGLGAELYLYGSRVRDDLKGGDIDLLLKVHVPAEADRLKLKIHVLLNEIAKRVGERRVDLSIKSESSLQGDPFWELTLKNAILLKKWE